MNPVVTDWTDCPPEQYVGAALAADREACLRLALTPGFGPKAFRAAMEAFGGPDGSARLLLDVPLTRLKRLRAQLQAGGEDAPVDKLVGHSDVDLSPLEGWPYLAYCDPDYPPRLRSLADPPLVLWYRGRLPRVVLPPVAIVGSRRSTLYGRKVAADMARDFSRAGLEVVSGMAIGIDGAAHRGALEGGSGTTAVLAHGIDGCFPAVHRDLSRQIEANGTLLTEYPPGTPAFKGHFVQRNRIIAGMSAVVIVAESRSRGGAIHTARFAAEGGTAVFAVPGDISKASAAGSNALLNDGASLLVRAADLIPQLNPGYREDAGVAVSRASNSERRLLAFLADGPQSVNALCAASGLPVATLLTELLDLQLEGRVEAHAGGVYSRTSG
ncbi:MAG: DNA processing protein [Rhodothermales bacterium]